MKIVASLTGEKFTKYQYDQLMEEMEIEQHPPKGLLTHIAGFDSQGIRMIDVWETEGDFRDFVDKRLRSGLQKVGFKDRPEVTIYPLHMMMNGQMHR